MNNIFKKIPPWPTSVREQFQLDWQFAVYSNTLNAFSRRLIRLLDRVRGLPDGEAFCAYIQKKFDLADEWNHALRMRNCALRTSTQAVEGAHGVLKDVLQRRRSQPLSELFDASIEH